MAIIIRQLTTLEECEAFQQVERMIWGSDDESLMPIHVLITLAHNGGLVLGAYADDGPVETGGMVGMALGWYGTATPPDGDKPQLKMCSHMAGVLPVWQRQRVGFKLKYAQLEWTKRDGVTNWMTWTYDPLYRANGVFNMHRLGGVSRSYYPNFYGEMTDMLNSGGPSDRCKVDWWLDSAHVERAVARATGAAAGAPAPTLQDYVGIQVLPTAAAGAFRAPGGGKAHFDGRPVGVPVPNDIGAIRMRDRELALAWRFALRAHLQEGFAAGYTLVDCLQAGDDEWRYILTPHNPARQRLAQEGTYA